MYGARIEVPHSHCHHRDFFFAMSGGNEGDGDEQSRGGRGRGRGHRGFGPHGRGGRRGRRARRGDIRLAILLLLDEEPRNGYAVMQEVEERSGGVWRPSPGSVYPALAQLEDEGLVKPTEEGRKAFTLTDEGVAHVEANRETMGTPWQTAEGGASSELGDLRTAGKALAMAVRQVAQTGNQEQLARATEVISGARKSLYRLLAGDDPDASEDSDS